MKKNNRFRSCFPWAIILLILMTGCEPSTDKLTEDDVDKLVWEQYNNQIAYAISEKSSRKDDMILLERKFKLVSASHPNNDPYSLSMQDYIARDLSKIDSVLDRTGVIVRKAYIRLYYRAVISKDGQKRLSVLLDYAGPSDSAKQHDMEWLRTLPRVQSVRYLTSEEKLELFKKEGGTGDSIMDLDYQPPPQYEVYISIKKLREDHMDTLMSFIQKNIPGSKCRFTSRVSKGYRYVYEVTQKYQHIPQNKQLKQ